MQTIRYTLSYTDEETDECVEEEIEIPGKWAICSVCEGEGSAPSPGLRGHVYTSEDFERDPDLRGFLRDMNRGVYNVSCEGCSGSGKVLVMDLSKVHDEDLKNRIRRCEKGRLEDEAVSRCERAMEAGMSGDMEGYNLIGGGYADY